MTVCSGTHKEWHSLFRVQRVVGSVPPGGANGGTRS